MSARIAAAFARAKHEGRAALIVYVCAGDPDLATTARLVPALALAGADVIELGVPFSDPIADGPVIQAASERALVSGTTLRSIVRMVAQLRAGGLAVPLALMTYLNPLHAFGDLDAVARAGADALIVPDLPHDEAPPWRDAIGAAGMDLIALAAPTTTTARLAAIAAVAQGFLYFVSVTGVTGARADLPPALPAQLAAARVASRAPVAVGFGVDSPAQARALAAHADGVIVGSALITRLASGGEAAAVAFVQSLRAALDGTRPSSTSSSLEVASC